jgi:hypothetical protein
MIVAKLATGRKFVVAELDYVLDNAGGLSELSRA